MQVPDAPSGPLFRQHDAPAPNATTRPGIREQLATHDRKPRIREVPEAEPVAVAVSAAGLAAAASLEVVAAQPGRDAFARADKPRTGADGNADGQRIREAVVTESTETIRIREAASVPDEGETIRIREAASVPDEGETIRIREAASVPDEGETIRIREAASVPDEGETIRIREAASAPDQGESATQAGPGALELRVDALEARLEAAAETEMEAQLNSRVSQLEAFSLSAAQLEQQLEREEKQDRQEILQLEDEVASAQAFSEWWPLFVLGLAAAAVVGALYGRFMEVAEAPPLPPEGLPPGWSSEKWLKHGAVYLARTADHASASSLARAREDFLPDEVLES